MKQLLHKLFDLKKLTAAAVILITAIAAAGLLKASADSSVSVKEINYSNSTIVIQMASADTKLYLSDTNQKKWEYVPVAKAADNTVTMDISWVSSTKDYTLSFKGDASTSPIKVVIPKQLTTLKVSYSTYTNSLTFTNAGGKTLQWKKKEAMTWSTVTYDASGNMTSPNLESLCDNGAALMFRIAPVNGTSASSTGIRAGKEATVTITKKSTAPTITVNDEYMAVEVAKNMQYRYVDEDSNPTGSGAWTTISKSGYMLLSEIAPAAIISDTNPAPSDSVYIQFRTLATSSKQISNTTTIEIPAQEALPSGASSNIKVVYTSSTTFEIRIPYAGTETPYEYCIINTDDIKDGITISDYENLKWKRVTSTTAVSINKDNDDVEDGSLIYVRRASYLTLGDDDYEIASPYLSLGAVDYPGTLSSTSGSSLEWLTTIAGRCNKANTEGYITFTLQSPTDNVITKIEFVDYASTSTVRGTLTLADGDFKSTVAENQSATGTDDKYIITTTIMSTEKIDSAASDEDTRRMLAYITLEDSTEAFESSEDEGGIALYISPATEVNNPSGNTEDSDKKEISDYLGWTNDTDSNGVAFYNEDKDIIKYSTAFTRVVNSNKYYIEGDSYYGVEGNYDDTCFRVRLDIGTLYTPDSSNPGAFTAEKVTVTKIKYDGVYFTAGQTVTKSDGSQTANAAFTVEYADTKNDDNEDTRLALLTINADAIELSPSVDDRNKDTAVIIYLSNGEILKTGVTLNLRETATIVGTTNSWSITEASLTEIDTTTTTADGLTTVTTKDHVDRTITLTVFKDGYDVSLQSVTWNGYSVCNNISKQGTSITMDLDNKEINKIDVSSTTSAYLVFTFDNGFSITTGWKLTINPSATN